MRLSASEWTIYQKGLELFLESERFVIRAEFATIMGPYPEELRAALDQNVVHVDGGDVEVPQELVKEFVKLIGLFLVGYTFSKKETAEIQGRVGKTEEELLTLEGDLRVRLGLRREPGPPPTEDNQEKT